jgi:DNA invertase Pin-like site-specific DNA recombinase
MSAATVRRAVVRESVGTTGKLRAEQLSRKAVIYVRQSSLAQVKNNTESGRLQYALVKRAMALGFEREQVEVIDEDQGQSGTSREGRAGFERLLAMISASQVGLVLSLEVSRLARSNLDWQMLVRYCQFSGTLVGEQEGLYDPTQANDQLLLGVKGAISEFEIALLRQRMEQGRRAKAERGELVFALPVGYVLGEQGRWELDPDSSVLSCLELLFATFERLGSVRQVVKYFNEQQLRLPHRERRGRQMGPLRWERASTGRVRQILKNPLYTGAYVWGRRRSEPARKKPGRPYSGVRFVEPEQWLVYLPEHHAAYISTEQYEQNVKNMRQNAPRGLGAPRSGPSLLAGLLHCAVCGSRMQVSYSNNGTGLRYSCIAADLRAGAPRCQSVMGPLLEQAVEGEVLAALEPASIELSVSAIEQFEASRAALERSWQQKLEQARYEVTLARRRYEAVDPQHRLVASNLEKDWNEALVALERLEVDFERFRAQQSPQLTEQRRAELLSLAQDIPALWHASSTTPQQRQSIVRILLERVELRLEGHSERLSLTLFWSGGEHSVLELRRPVKKLEQLSFYPQMLQQLEALLEHGLHDQSIAERLGALGFHSPRLIPLSAAQVGRMRRSLGRTRPGGKSNSSTTKSPRRAAPRRRR